MCSDFPSPRSNPLWYKDAIIYEVHVRAFRDSNGDGIGDFRGLTARLDYLQQLGVNAIWLLPFYPSPLRDDGYDIAEYKDVHPSYGTLDEFCAFLAEAHSRDMRVITELVINHTSDRHPWFQRARRSPAGSPERDFYVWSDTPDKYPDVRIIFQDTETSNWTWDPVANAYYWHRFFSHQPDLNYDNPMVRDAVVEVLDFWFGLGVDGLRLDAVPYLYERDGTNGENLPETHAELKRLRAHIDANYDGRMLLSEANQWPEDAAAYFGDGDESHMAFHFPLMPRLFLALETENRLPVIDILEQTPEIPDNAQWAIFLRNHDELTLEMVTEEERDFMWRSYAPDRRARLNLGIRRRLAPLLENDRRRIELLFGLLFSLPGTPVIYYGDEIGMGDNIFLADRDGVRTPMQWSNDRNAGFSNANPQSLYLPVVVDPQYHYESVNVEAQHANPNSLLWWVRRMIRRRRRHQVFGRGTLTFLDPANPHVLAFLRQNDRETILVVANLSRRAQYVELDLSQFEGSVLTELIGRTQFPPIGELPYLLTLGPHAFHWFAVDPVGSPAELDSEVEIIGPLEALFGTSQPLADHLASYVRNQTWYLGRGRDSVGASVRDAIPIVQDPDHSSWLVLVDIEFSHGEPHRYVVPLTVVFGTEADGYSDGVIARVRRNGTSGVAVDGIRDRRFLSEVLSSLGQDREVMSGTGALNYRYFGDPAEISENVDRLLEKIDVVDTPQGETIVQFGDEFDLKLFRVVEPGVNPDLELRRFLTERTGFESHVPVAGFIEYRSADPFTIAVVEAIPGEGPTALHAFRDELEAFLASVPAKKAAPVPTASWLEAVRRPKNLPDLESAEGLVSDLARLIARFHSAVAAFSEDPAMRPESFTALYQQSLYQSLRAHLRREIRALKRMSSSVPDEIRQRFSSALTAESSILRCIDVIRRIPMEGQRVRLHGDLRLDEVAYREGEFRFMDLSGDHTQLISERRLKASPLRDVAEMLRSLHYLAVANSHGKNRSWALWWYRALGERFIQSYLDEMTGSPALPTQPSAIDALLYSYGAVRSIHELRWEVINRPDWISVALAGVELHAECEYLPTAG